MDADLRNIFYVVGSVALILISLSIIAIFYLIVKVKKAADETLRKIGEMTLEVTNQSKSLAKTWERLTLTRFFIRILKLIF